MSTISILLDDWVEGFKGNTRNFINSILGREEPYITAGQGRYILKIALAIQKSNRLHREVYLDEMDAGVSQPLRAENARRTC